MGLALAVGVLRPEVFDNVELTHAIHDQFEKINGLLERNGLPKHAEPSDLPETMHSYARNAGLPYDWSDYLKRVYAHRLQKSDYLAVGPTDDDEPWNDPLLQHEYAKGTSHLVNHSYSNGFYVPLHFDRVLLDKTGEIWGERVGSSFKLMENLCLVAPALGIALEQGVLSHPEAERIVESLDEWIDEEGTLYREWSVWLEFYEYARLSLEHRTALLFT